LYDAIKNMSETIQELASRKGFEGFLKEQPVKEGEGAEKEDVGAAMKDLNKTIGDMKLNMEFMGKLLDELRYEPVIQSDLVGE